MECSSAGIAVNHSLSPTALGMDIADIAQNGTVLVVVARSGAVFVVVE